MFIQVVDYSSQEREYGNGMKKWEDEKGPLLNLAWGPRGLNPALSARQPTLVACSQRIACMLRLITYNALNYRRRLCQTTFIHPSHFYGAPSNPLLLRGARSRL